jgi:uncharacterized protein with HEPN domain
LPFREVRAHLLDIQESIDNIGFFLEDVEFETYCADLKTKSAVERQMQIISEASVRLSDGEIVWDTVKLDLPLLKACVDRLLSQESISSRREQ